MTVNWSTDVDLIRTRSHFTFATDNSRAHTEPGRNWVRFIFLCKIRYSHVIHRRTLASVWELGTSSYHGRS